MEQIADVTGIREELTKVFNGTKEVVNAILTLAHFPTSGRGTYDHLSAWMRIVKVPYDVDLSSPSISIFTQSITEQNRMDLFCCRAKRFENDELCATDSTSCSTWGSCLPDIHYGKSKDMLPIPQTMEVVGDTLNKHMPVLRKLSCS